MMMMMMPFGNSNWMFNNINCDEMCFFLEKFSERQVLLLVVMLVMMVMVLVMGEVDHENVRHHQCGEDTAPVVQGFSEEPF